jgi:hypothetical protein
LYGVDDISFLKIPHPNRTSQLRVAGQGTSVEDGMMKSDVTIRLTSGRAEMPCGLKPWWGG